MGKILLFDENLGLTDENGNELTEDFWSEIKNIEESKKHKSAYNKKGKSVKGYVYFMSDKSCSIKIGCTTNIKNRKYQLATTHSKLDILRLIKCDDIYCLEKLLHFKFRDKKIKGEWFALTKNEILNYDFGDFGIMLNAEDVKLNV